MTTEHGHEQFALWSAAQASRRLTNPDHWKAASGRDERCPAVGALVAHRYGVWRVLELNPVEDADLTDEQRKSLNAYKVGARNRSRPYRIVLCHETGPMLDEHSQRLHDGRRTAHYGVGVGWFTWRVLDERYQTCSCHGHPWPCQDHDRDLVSAGAAVRLDQDMRTTEPGICAACLEPITTRQKSLTFPEGSLLVPGAPGPTFHAGRSACWAKARLYELDRRLAVYQDVARVASCPGILFVHMADSREECTAEKACTGCHGPAGGRVSFSCVERHYLAAGEGCYPRPPSDCGYHGGFGRCLGADLSLGAPDPFSIGDTLGRRRPDIPTT